MLYSDEQECRDSCADLIEIVRLQIRRAGKLTIGLGLHLRPEWRCQHLICCQREALAALVRANGFGRLQIKFLEKQFLGSRPG
jgi:hypothetical protein